MYCRHRTFPSVTAAVSCNHRSNHRSNLVSHTDALAFSSDMAGRRCRLSGRVRRQPAPVSEYLPPGYGDGSPRPLLVFLHGIDEEADGSEASLASILRLGVPQLIAEGEWPSERPFIVLMPQEPVAKSQRCDFGPEIDRFLEFAVDRYEIDEARIYLTGISCGAIGIWDYLAETDDNTIAAAVPISDIPPGRWTRPAVL